MILRDRRIAINCQEDDLVKPTSTSSNMEEFTLIKSRVNLNRVNLGIALISDLKV